MNIEEFREYCLSKPGVEEYFPFDETTLAFKVGGKIFALVGLDAEEFTVNLKCDPEKAIMLREYYPDSVLPGYHMNKVHWNTVHFGGLHISLLRDLIDESYTLVVNSLPKKRRQLLL
jgi:predicted DNA-binding protein (MmcQ/YjbR family)